MVSMLRKIKQKMRHLKHRHLDRFIFIYIYKNGGITVVNTLNIPCEFRTALEKIGEIGREDWDKKLTFAVVRNPWDRVVTQYRFNVEMNRTNLRDNPIGFKEWVKLAYGKQDSFYYDEPKAFMPQLDWISDENDKILVDEIIHFENFENEFNALSKKLGKNATLSHKSLTHLKKLKNESYHEYYDTETIEIVRNWFKRDIEEFGYQF